MKTQLTVFLHVDLQVFIEATMTSAEGAVLSEADGLMVRLLPHQP